MKFANSSIDVSDGLITDLEKMINCQSFSYLINEDKIPVSNYLFEFIKNHKIKKSRLISNGDDYQILFTASFCKSRIIEKTSKILGIKITKIGKIVSGNNKSSIINQKGKQIQFKNKGFTHNF